MGAILSILFHNKFQIKTSSFIIKSTKNLSKVTQFQKNLK